MATKKFRLDFPVFDLTLPPAPRKPTHKKTIEVRQEFFNDSTQTANGKTISLLDALKKVDLDKVSLDDIKITFAREGSVYDTYTLKSRLIIHHTSVCDNPAYADAEAAYTAALDRHKLELQAYDKEKEKHKLREALWKKSTELKKLKAKKDPLVADIAKLKSLPIAITRLIKKLDLDVKPAEIMPMAAKNKKAAAALFEAQDDDLDDDYDDYDN